MAEATAKAIRLGILAFIKPVITSAEGRWVVLDYGTVLVHIFHLEDRQFYHLERLWEDGENRVALPFLEEEQA